MKPEVYAKIISTAQVQEDLCVLPAACEELRSSPGFDALLTAVLTLGNTLNQGTMRGGAIAFKLDTLLKVNYLRRLPIRLSRLCAVPCRSFCETRMPLYKVFWHRGSLFCITMASVPREYHIGYILP